MGALGCLFGAKLTPYAHVTVIGHWPEQLHALQHGPLLFTAPDGHTSRIHLRVTNNPAASPPADAALILTKSAGTRVAAASAARALQPDGIAITLQNGLGHLDTLAEHIGPERSIQGITTEAAHTAGQVAQVTHAAPGMTHLGAPVHLPERTKQRINDVAAVFQAAGLPTAITPKVDGLIWGKLAVNAAINPLTALLGVRNGDLLAANKMRRMMDMIAQEVAATAQAYGVTLPYDDPAQHVRDVARATAPNRSSMLQDVQRGAVTEIDAICGAVVRIAQAHGISTPVTQMLYDLVSARDAIILSQSPNHPASPITTIER